MDFLFVYSTPPRRLLWLHNVMIILVGRWLEELRDTFSIKVICHVAICFLVLCISKIIFLAVSFAMRCSFTSAIFMPGMRQML